MGDTSLFSMDRSVLGDAAAARESARTTCEQAREARARAAAVLEEGRLIREAIHEPTHPDGRPPCQGL